MKILDTATANPLELSSFEMKALYNGMDVCITRAVFDAIEPELDEITSKTYSHSRKLQAPVMEMMCNGVPLDENTRLDFINEFTSKQNKLDEIAQTLANALGFNEYFIGKAKEALANALEKNNLPIELVNLAIDKSNRKERTTIRKVLREELKKFDASISAYSKPFNPRSVKQKAELFYDMREFGGHIGVLGIKPIKKRSKQTGKMSASTDRAALEQLLQVGESRTRGKYFWARPFITTILSDMDVSKTLGQLRFTPDPEDNHFRCTFGITGTNTGRFNSKENPMGFGNNFQNWTDVLRAIFSTKPGDKLAYVDLEQAESRDVGAIVYTLFGETNYLAAVESGDLHTLNCSLAWDKEDWPENFNLTYAMEHGTFPKDMLDEAKIVAKKDFYRGKSYRDTAKTLDHGLNYRGKPPEMAKQTHIDEKIVKHFQAKKFSAFPGIPKWHKHVIQEIQTKRYIVSLMGRKRTFFGRVFEDATIRKAIAYNPQSSTADYLSLGILQVWEEIVKGNLPIKIFGQVHDALAFSYPEVDEHWIIPRVQELLEPKLTIKSPQGVSREFSIPTEALVGWNLAYKCNVIKEVDHSKLQHMNPDGLVVFTGKGDERIRTTKPSLGLMDRRLS